MFILFQVPLINKNGTKSMHCIIRGKFVISPCRKSALFWIHAVILLFHAEILPCGPPLLPHSCAEPFLGVMQKYSFLGDVYTSGSPKKCRWSPDHAGRGLSFKDWVIRAPCPCLMLMLVVMVMLFRYKVWESDQGSLSLRTPLASHRIEADGTEAASNIHNCWKY